MKSCDNCHLRFAKLQNCWDKIADDNCPYWEPETNGDRVRQMTDEELAELWSCTLFPEKYQANCKECKRDDNCEFSWYACPETFRSWLKDVSIQEKETKTDGKN